MDIRNSLEGLKSLLGAAPTASPAPQQQKGGSAVAANPMSSDHATLSSAGSEVSLTAADTGVRMDKVAGVQAALAAGTYNVPASAVATRLVDAMLGGRQ